MDEERVDELVERITTQVSDEHDLDDLSISDYIEVCEGLAAHYKTCATAARDDLASDV